MHSGLTKPGEVGNFFALFSMKSPNFLWWPFLLTDQDEMSNVYRGPSIDAAYQVSVHLTKQFQRRFLRNRPIRNKNGLIYVR
jgi:hypothetical protein